MKMGEILPKYQAYRNELQSKQVSIYKELESAKNKAEFDATGEWAGKAAELQLSYEEAEKQFTMYDDVLSDIKEQYTMAWNMENNRALADPETGMAATIGKVMTTVARMCAGDKVPASDEEKVREYNSEMYMKAKQCQMIMAAMKEKQKEYDTLWDKEGGEYDCEEAANNTEYSGELPDIPEGGTGEDGATSSETVEA